MSIYTSHIRPLLEYASCVWNTGYLGDLRLLERIQRKWTRAVHGLEEVSYGVRLRTLDIFSFRGRLLRADLILTYKIFHGLCAIHPGELFQVSQESWTRRHKYKIVVPSANLEIRNPQEVLC